jgi:peptide/nickel transport system permease protein
MGASATVRVRQPPPVEDVLDMSGWKRRRQELALSLRLLIKSPLAAAGLVIVLFYIGVALYAVIFVPRSQTMILDPSRPIPLAPWWWAGGGTGGWLGTTGIYAGIDMTDAIPKAIATDLIFSAFVVLVGALIGTLIGVYSAYKGGLFDEGLMRVTDVTYSIPFLVLAIAVAFVLNRRDFITLNEVLLVLWWPPYARLVRSQALSVKELRFVEAARAAGASDARIMLRHVLPNTLAPVFVQVSLDLGTVTQVFAALDFIGFAQQNPLLPELGNMINIGFSGFISYPWMVIIPGVVLLIFTVGVNLLGDGLRDVLDPRLRR